jgi:AcrR family transcriptional regulator
VSDQAASESRQRLPAARRRHQLLSVALERFAAKGYHAASMEEIAEAAGVTKPVLYQHFPSKRRLYLELLDTVGGDLVSEVAKRASAETQPHQQVLAGFRAYFRFVGERTSAFQLLFGSGARRTDEFADSIRALEESMAATISSYIVADIDDDHRELLGYAIVGLAEVAGRRWVALQSVDAGAEATGGDPTRPTPRLDPREAEQLAVRLADLAWAGLRGLPGGGVRDREGHIPEDQEARDRQEDGNS